MIGNGRHPNDRLLANAMHGARAGDTNTGGELARNK